jgi:hypothetical protein
MRLLTSTFAIALLAGCAAQPTSPPAPATSPVAIAAKATAPSADPVASTAAAPGKANVPPGYKAVERNGTTLYCTRVASLGTKFKREVCMTQDEYDEVRRRGESARQELRKSTTICAGGSGVSSCNGS